jgi:hypothetical protein
VDYGEGGEVRVKMPESREEEEKKKRKRFAGETPVVLF